MSGWVIAAPKLHHGLGNRVRAVLGAKSLADFSGRSFAYTWPVGRAFGARFDALWEVRERRLPAFVSPVIRPLWPYRGAELGWMDGAQSSRVWHIRTAHELRLPPGAPAWGEVLRGLEPVPRVAAHIRDLVGQLGDEPYVGVMVRTHPISNAETLKHSPISWFTERMSEIADHTPGVKFFVSADTSEVRRALRREFSSVVTRTDDEQYNSAPALQASLADLYVLAGAGHLLAPHYSSFPELALHLADGALRLETSRTTASTRFAPGDRLDRAADPLRPSVRVVA